MQIKICFALIVFLIKPQDVIFINRILNFNTFGGGFISGGRLIIWCIFCLQVDRYITGGAYKCAGVGGLTVFVFFRVFINFRCLGPLLPGFHSFGVLTVLFSMTLQMNSISGIMVHFKGLFYISRKLPTYPSPKFKWKESVKGS